MNQIGTLDTAGRTDSMQSKLQEARGLVEERRKLDENFKTAILNMSLEDSVFIQEVESMQGLLRTMRQLLWTSRVTTEAKRFSSNCQKLAKWLDWGEVQGHVASDQWIQSIHSVLVVLLMDFCYLSVMRGGKRCIQEISLSLDWVSLLLEAQDLFLTLMDDCYSSPSSTETSIRRGLWIIQEIQSGVERIRAKQGKYHNQYQLHSGSIWN